MLVAIKIYSHRFTTTCLQLSKYISIGSSLHTCSYQNIFPQVHHYILVANKIYFHGVTTTCLQLSKCIPIGSPRHACSYQNIFPQGHHYMLVAIKISFHRVTTTCLQLSKYLSIGSPLHTCSIKIYFHGVTTTYLQLSKYLLKRSFIHSMSKYIFIGLPLHACSYHNIFPQGHHYMLVAIKIYFHRFNTTYVQLSRRVFQRDNQNPYIEEEQTTQWQKEKVQKDKQRPTKYLFIGSPLHTCSYQNIHAYVCQSVNLFIGSSLHTCSGEATDKPQVLA